MYPLCKHCANNVPKGCFVGFTDGLRCEKELKSAPNVPPYLLYGLLKTRIAAPYLIYICRRVGAGFLASLFNSPRAQCLRLEQFFNLLAHVFKAFGGFETGHHKSLLVNEELGEVPFDVGLFLIVGVFFRKNLVEYGC